MKGYFSFRAWDQETWVRFGHIWSSLGERIVNGVRLGGIAVLRPEKRTLTVSLNGIDCAEDIIYELFDALYPLQADASGCFASWMLRDAHGTGRGHMGCRFPVRRITKKEREYCSAGLLAA